MKRLFTLLIIALVAFGMMNEANATTCAGAASIPATPTFPWVSSLTCGTTDDINSLNATACGSSYYLGGWEAVYVWTPGANYIDVSFAYSGQTWTGLMLYQGCPTSGGTCMANVTSSTSAKTLAYMGTNMTSGPTISLSSGVTYYLVIDTWPTPQSPCPGTVTINGTMGVACSGMPAPGLTISSANPVCPAVSFTLSLQNATPGTGVTYLWQSSATGGDPWTSMGTASTQTTTQTAATYYRCQVTCSGNTGTSTPLQVTMNTPTNCYCTSMASSTADEEIYSVTVAGLTNAYTCTTVAPGPGSILNRYSNFTTLGSLFTLPLLTPVSFTVEENECDAGTYYAFGCGIWVDFNQDGDFDDTGEEVFKEATTLVGPRNVTGTITAPTGSLMGQTRMRVTVAEGYSGATLTPCLAYGYGETEDYLVTIGAGAACPPPYNLGANAVTSNSANLYWTEGGSATAWQYAYGPSPFPAPSGAGTSTTDPLNNPIFGLSPQTPYQFWARSMCTGENSTWSGPYPFTTLCAETAAPWCEVFQAQTMPLCWAISGPQNWVFTNTWPDYGADLVTDHTGTGGSFAGVDGSGSTGLTGITLTSPMLDKSALPSAQLRFFVFNNNTSSVLLTDEQQMTVSVWDGAAWQLAYTWPYGKNNAAWEEVTIPLNAYPDVFQLKFVVDKGTSLPFYDDMIIDDICVEVPPACPIPSALLATPSAFSAVLDWTENGSALSWDIEWGQTPYAFTDNPNLPGVTKPYNLLSLDPATEYIYKVRSVCGAEYSPWSTAKIFSTLETCPDPTGGNAQNLTYNSADLYWISNASGTSWNVEVGAPGFLVGTGAEEQGFYETEDMPLHVEGLTPATPYQFYVQEICGLVQPRLGHFWYAADQDFNMLPEFSSGFAQPAPGQDLTFQNYYDPETSLYWNNIWFYNDPLDMNKMKKIRMGFYIQRLDPGADATFDYVINWSNELWGPGSTTYPQPGDEGFIARSPENGQMPVLAGDAQWVEIYYTIPDYNPEWVSVDIWGQNIIILNEVSEPPHTSPLYQWWLQEPTAGGIIVHECLPKPYGDVSGWAGPYNFSTTVACPAPTDGIATDITQNSANLTWTPGGGETAWEYVYGLAPLPAPAGAGTPSTSSTVNPINGLAGSSSYQFYVRAMCGGDLGNSVWAGPYSFATTCGVANLPLCESFPTATWPACWTEQVEGLITTNHWGIVNSNVAGGTAYEAMANYYPGEGATQADNDRMVSPPFNTTGLTSISVSFRQMLNDYNAGVNDVWIKVQSSSDGLAWTDEWVYNGGLGISIPAEVKDMTITNNLGGTTWIAWTLSGYTYDINYWYVDDICISVPLLLDAKTVSIDDVPALTIPGTPLAPKATVKNNGITSPVTFDVTMTATDGYTSTVYGVTLASGAQTQVAFAPWTPGVGNYTVTTCTQLAGDQDITNDCLSQPVGVQNMRKVYGYVAYDPTASNPEGPAYFYVQSPGTIISLGATTSDQFIGAGTWAEGVWYGSEYYDAATLSGGGWWSINEVTGFMTKIADFDQGFAGIAYNKNTGVMYGTIYTGLGTNYNDLYTIDRFTGVATYLGSIGGTDLLIDLASDGSNYLYSTMLGTDQLVKIDPVALTVTVVGPTGFAFNYAQDMEWDYDFNIMYHAGYTSTGSLYTVNMTTGAYSLIGNFQGGAEICGFAIPYTAGCTTNTWTGTEGTAWDEPLNWSCGSVPDATVSVIIPTGLTNYPVVGAGVTGHCFDIEIHIGAMVTVATGGDLIVENP